MMVKVLLLPLFLLLTPLTGVCPQGPTETFVKAGEMVALYCPHYRGYNHDDAKVIWTSYTSQEMDVTSMSSAEQRQMAVLVQGGDLVILSASVNHQGNYSCSLGDAGSQSWFRLIVYSAPSENKMTTQYNYPCPRSESCTLDCPDVNTPDTNITNITIKDIIWYKEGESLPKDSYFSRVEDNDRGVYTCTRYYLYLDQVYNMTFTVVLDLEPEDIPVKMPAITSPRESGAVYVDLSSTVVIECKAVLYSDFDEVFWSSGESFIETNSSFPVFYNYTRENNAGEIKMTASLVFKKVSEEDLSKNYTCYLGPQFITITLVQKSISRPSYSSLAFGIVSVVVVVTLTTLIYVMFKIDITLFLRDTLGFHSSTSDGKSYDAFLMCYKSDTDVGLNEDDRKWLESVLEERFGYSLCLYDRDVLPGKAVVEAVLDCVEQSRTVVLVPTSPDAGGPGSGLLNAIHAALVERQTRLVFIRTEPTKVSKSGSLSEGLELLSEAGDSVTWKGKHSMPSSSSFWKQLRYYLPAPHHPPVI